MYERLNEIVAEISHKTGENIAVEFKSGKISRNTIRSGKIIIKGNINKVFKKLNLNKDDNNSSNFRLICSFIYALNRILYEGDYCSIKGWNKHLTRTERRHPELVKKYGKEYELAGINEMIKEAEEKGG